MANAFWDDESKLRPLDARGLTVLDALTLSPLRASSGYTAPFPFVCVDGETYWAKADAQRGLTAELIAGRIGGQLRMAPMSAIVRIVPEVVAQEPNAQRLVGVRVGSRHAGNDAFNVKDIAQFIQGGTLLPSRIDEASRARAVAFQTWIGLQDAQLFIDAATGRVVSADHGECFQDVVSLTAPTLIVTAIPGIPQNHGSDSKHVSAAVSAIEGFTDQQLLEAVSRIPSGAEWQSDLTRRFAIGKWLAYRRDNLRVVVEAWK